MSILILATLLITFLTVVESAIPSGRKALTVDKNFNQASNGDNDKHDRVYDNEITSDPEIECGYGVVHFRVFTTKGQASSVFVRGQSNNDDCVFHNTHNVTIELAKCNIRRKREVNPSGINYQMTVVVQLHPLFVTKVDRAYNVNCFYMEKRQDVNVEFGVSDITTAMVQSEALLPLCSYAVHRDSPNGPLVKYTRVGEQLYHVWECPSKMYSMLLYNCMAIDGKGTEFIILDENGCSKDEFLMPQISYTADNTKAMVASAAFNFPDRNTMSFTCKIRLCYNSDCRGVTPPNCGGNKGNIDANSFTTSTDEPLSQHLDGDHLVESSSTFSTPPSTNPTTSKSKADRSGVPEKEDEETSKPRSTESERRTTSKEWTSPSAQTTRNSPPTSSQTTKWTTTSSEEPSTRARTTPASWEVREDDTTPLASDFPRPSSFLLPQADEPLSRTSNEVRRADESVARPAMSLSSTSTKASSTSAEVVSSTSHEAEEHETTPPVQILKKSLPLTLSAQAAAAANSKNSADSATKQPNRQQRDTTSSSSSGSAAKAARLHNKRVVDFDIASPELTIMDDYLEPGTAQKLTGAAGANSQSDISQQLRDAYLWRQQASTGVCFSSTALIVAGALMALLTISVIFVFMKSRKTVHSFY